MATELASETEQLLAELEKIGQDFSDIPPPPPLPPSDDLLDSPTDLPPAPDPSDMFESVVTFSKGKQKQILILLLVCIPGDLIICTFIRSTY